MLYTHHGSWHECVQFPCASFPQRPVPQPSSWPVFGQNSLEVKNLEWASGCSVVVARGADITQLAPVAVPRQYQQQNNKANGD